VASLWRMLCRDCTVPGLGRAALIGEIFPCTSTYVPPETACRRIMMLHVHSQILKERVSRDSVPWLPTSGLGYCAEFGLFDSKAKCVDLECVLIAGSRLSGIDSESPLRTSGR
jgi:hypothetical protein